MLPRRWIQAMKNRTPIYEKPGALRTCFVLVACVLLLSGCTPPGPRALRRGNSAEGLLKLGLAQLRSRELVGAEKSFTDALRLNPQSPEGLNGLGLVRVQRGHPDEAAKLFRSALKAQPDYRPALLNLAIISDEYLKDL